MSYATIADAWESYRALIPPSASRGQIIETKRAFYAGVASTVEFMEETEAARGEKLRALYIEALAFAQSVAAGEA